MYICAESFSPFHVYMTPTLCPYAMPPFGLDGLSTFPIKAADSRKHLNKSTFFQSVQLF